MSWSIYRKTGDDLVTPETLGAAQEHKILIEIMKPNKVDGDPLTSIEGFSKEAFTYSVQAEYSSILGWEDIQSKAFKILKDATQRNEVFYSGYASKKMFTPGKAYVQLNLKFRVYDDPDIISRCDLLTKCCLPIISRENFMLNTNTLGVVGDFVGNIGQVLGEAAYGFVTNGVGAAVGSVAENITDNMTTSMPPHLRISFGSYFKKSEMVLTNCNFTFSKEFTKYEGRTFPTYVDFDLQVESLYSSLAMGADIDSKSKLQSQIFGPGFMSDTANSRVVIDVIDEYESANPIAGVGQQANEAWNKITGTPTK